jgi:hypothetical protein
MGGVANEIEEHNPAAFFADLHRCGVEIGALSLRLLASEGEGAVTELDQVSVSEHGLFVKPQTIEVGTVRASEVGKNVSSACARLEHRVEARHARGLKDQGVGVASADGAWARAQPVNAAVGFFQPGLGVGGIHAALAVLKRRGPIDG